MRGSKFVPDSIDLLYNHLQKIDLKRGGLYIDFREWLENKKQQQIQKIMMEIVFGMP